MKYFTHYIEFATCYNQLSKLKIDKRRHFMTLKMLHRQSINQNESGEFLAEANCRIRWLVQQIDLEYLFSYVFLIVASIEMTHRVGGKLECRICITLISRQIVIVGHSRVNMRFLLSICIRMSRQQKGYIFKWCFLCCCAFIYIWKCKSASWNHMAKQMKSSGFVTRADLWCTTRAPIIRIFCWLKANTKGSVQLTKCLF